MPGRLTSAVLAVTVLLVGGCAAGSSPAGDHEEGVGIRVRYESVHEGGEAGGIPQVLEVIAEGDRFRMAVSDATTPERVYQTVVWDGQVMVLLDGEDASRQEDPSPEERPTPFIIRAGDATFEQICPGGAPEGSAQVAGRAGTVYACPASGAGDLATESSQLTLDDATGPEDGTDGSGTPLPLTATDSVPKAGGGELRLADVRDGPSLVVIGELPGVTAMLATVLPATSAGTAPPVYVLLNPIPFTEDEPDNSDLSLATEEGTQRLLEEVSAQVRDVPVPVGIDIKGGAAGEDLRSFEDLMAGTTVLAARAALRAATAPRSQRDDPSPHAPRVPCCGARNQADRRPEHRPDSGLLRPAARGTHCRGTPADRSCASPTS